MLERIKILKEHITEKYKKGRSKRINCIAEEIRENVDNGGKIWEHKRKHEKKVKTPYSITNAEGIKLENRSSMGWKPEKNCQKQKFNIQKKSKVKALKRIFNQPIITPFIGLIIETGVWPAEQKMNYSSLMLYHNIIKSSKDRLVKQIIQEQRAQNHQNTYDEVRIIAKELNIKLEAAVTMKKLEWKRTVKYKVQNKIQERVEREIENKTKLRTVRDMFIRSDY